MILNTYAVLDLFLVALRFPLSVLAICLSIAAWRIARRPATLRSKGRFESQYYLLFLLAFLLLGLNLASWPLFYLLMQSYIPQWPGVMCIYGVTQVGSGSLGASRFLPALVLTLQWIKPVTVLLSGSWLVLYLLNRRTRTGLLAPRVLIMVGLVGVVAACDSAVEAAYLLIPKTEHFLSAGCCTASGRAPTIAGLVLERGIAGEGHGSLITGAYYVIHIGMVFVLAVCGLPSRLRGAAHWLWALLLGGLASLAAWVLFVVDVVAPLLLHERNHHCPYDLMAQAPASLVATAALAAASLTLSWTCVAAWFGQSAETGFWVERAVRRGLRISCCGYIVSVIVLSTRMALA